MFSWWSWAWCSPFTTCTNMDHCTFAAYLRLYMFTYPPKSSNVSWKKAQYFERLWALTFETCSYLLWHEIRMIFKLELLYSLPLWSVKVIAKRDSVDCLEISLMSTWNRTCRWNITGPVLFLLYSTLNDIGELTLWDSSAICKNYEH